MVNGRSLGAHFYQDSGGGGAHKVRKKPPAARVVARTIIAVIVAILALMSGVMASTETYDSEDHCSSTYGSLTRHTAPSVAESCFEFTDGVEMDTSGASWPTCVF